MRLDLLIINYIIYLWTASLKKLKNTCCDIVTSSVICYLITVCCRSIWTSIRKGWLLCNPRGDKLGRVSLMCHVRSTLYPSGSLARSEMRPRKEGECLPNIHFSKAKVLISVVFVVVLFLVKKSKNWKCMENVNHHDKPYYYSVDDQPWQPEDHGTCKIESFLLINCFWMPPKKTLDRGTSFPLQDPWSWEKFKTFVKFHYIVWSFGILIMAYFNPHISGWYPPPF